MSLPPPARLGREGAARAPCPPHQGAFPALLEGGAAGLGLAQLPGGSGHSHPLLLGSSHLPQSQSVAHPPSPTNKIPSALPFSAATTSLCLCCLLLPHSPCQQAQVTGRGWVGAHPWHGSHGCHRDPSPLSAHPRCPGEQQELRAHPGWALSSPGDAQPKPQPLQCSWAAPRGAAQP